MNHKTIRDRYFELLKTYVTQPEEEGLTGIAALGRELAAAGVPPEDVAGWHEAALDRLAREMPQLTSPETVRLISAPLHELMVAYGLSFREKIEQLEREVADYADLEARQAHFQSLLEARSEINQLIVLERDPQTIMATACEVLERTRGYDGVWIGMLEQADTCVRAVARAGIATDGKSAEVSLDEEGTTLTCARTALRTGQPYLVKDVDESHPCAACTYRQIVPHVGSLAVPIRFQGERYGVIVVYSQRPWAFGDEETELLVELAGDLGLGLRTIRANAALQASEEKFRGLFENAAVAIGISNPAGKVVALNRAMIEITGYSLEEFSKISLGDTYVNSGDRKRFLEIMKRDGMVAGFDVQLRNKEGEPYWASLSSRPIIYNGEDAFLTTALDVTERVRAEEALAGQEAELRATLYGIGDAVIAADIEGRVARMNPVAEQLTGWSEAEAAGRPLDEVFQIINEETRRHVESPVARVLREGVVIGLANHTVLIAKDGKEIPIADSGAPITDAQGEITGVVLVFRDQTEERRAQERQRLLSSIVESSFDAIISKTLDGTIVSWNAAAERIFGYSAQEMVGQSILDLVPPDRADELWQWLEHIRQGEGLEMLETVRQRKDGQLIDVVLTISPIIDDAGKVIGASTISRDQTERKRAEQALRESEEKYRSLFESANDSIFIIDPSTRHFLDANENAARRLGYTRKELLRLTIDDIDTPMAAVRNEAIIQELQERGSVVFEHAHRRKDGTEMPIEISSRVVEYGGQRVFQSIVRDITERVQAEDEIRLREQQLSLIYDSVGDVLYYLRVEPGPNYRFLTVNRAFLEATGLTKEQVVGKTVNEVIPEPSLQLVRSNYEKAIRERRIVYWEETSPYPAGLKTGIVSIAPVFDEEGNCTHLVGSVHDITERVQAEEQLRRTMEKLDASEKRLRTIIETEPECVKILAPDGALVDMNRAGLDMIEADSLEQVQGQSILPIIAPEYRRAFRAMLDSVMRGNAEMLVFETIGLKGTRRWLETHSVPLYDAGNKATGLLGVTRDITARVRAEEDLKAYSEQLEEMVEERTQELRDAQEKLVSKEKLAVLGQLAGGIAHELRNPLGAISNTAYLLHLFIEKPEPDVAEALQILDVEVRNSDRIINSLLDFARPSPPIAHRMDVNAVVEEALSRADLPANVEVVRELDESLPHAVADPEHLRQALGNIIRNAAQAMPEGGRLAVNSEQAGDALPDTGDWILIAVSDTGVGIPPENLDKLFEPLFTTKAKGIGLGLALCKMLVEASGGTIEVQSPSTSFRAGEEGKGSTFTVRLPVSPVQ